MNPDLGAMELNVSSRPTVCVIVPEAKPSGIAKHPLGYLLVGGYFDWLTVRAASNGGAPVRDGSTSVDYTHCTEKCSGVSLSTARPQDRFADAASSATAVRDGKYEKWTLSPHLNLDVVFGDRAAPFVQLDWSPAGAGGAVQCTSRSTVRPA